LRGTLRGVLVAALFLVPLGPEALTGCGSDSPPPAGGTPDAAATATATAGDGSVSYVMVVTGGGGSGQTSSSSGGDPFQPTVDASQGDDDSGLAPDTGSDSSTGIQDSGDTDAAPQCGANYVPPTCGTTPCDLRANKCCITVDFSTFTLKGRCVPAAQACKSSEQTVRCLQACECGGDQSCCGVGNQITASVQTVCQSVPNGGFCQPHTDDPNPAQAAEQFCKTDEECKNGQPCIAQTCTTANAKFSLCGLQSQKPFECHADNP